MENTVPGVPEVLGVGVGKSTPPWDDPVESEAPLQQGLVKSRKPRLMKKGQIWGHPQRNKIHTDLIERTKSLVAIAREYRLGGTLASGVQMLKAYRKTHLQDLLDEVVQQDREKAKDSIRQDLENLLRKPQEVYKVAMDNKRMTTRKVKHIVQGKETWVVEDVEVADPNLEIALEAVDRETKILEVKGEVVGEIGRGGSNTNINMPIYTIPMPKIAPGALPGPVAIVGVPPRELEAPPARPGDVLEAEVVEESQ
jgi:hypothetical protein